MLRLPLLVLAAFAASTVAADPWPYMKRVSSNELPLLVEADGSRRLPLKAPAPHEPVIPEWVNTVVVVAGLSGLGKLLDPAWVHRPEIFAHLSGLELNAPVTSDGLINVLTHPQGGLKDIPYGARRVALLNQAGRLPLAGPQERLGWMIAELGEIALEWYRTQGQTYTYTEAGSRQELNPKDIPEDVELTANLDVNLPQDKLQAANVASILMQAGPCSS